MRPDDRDLDDEIRGHLALCVKERIDRGEDPEAARLAALREFGYIADVRESMRRVWYTRWFDAITALGREMRIGMRSLRRAKGRRPGFPGHGLAHAWAVSWYSRAAAWPCREGSARRRG